MQATCADAQAVKGSLLLVQPLKAWEGRAIRHRISAVSNSLVTEEQKKGRLSAKLRHWAT